MRGAEVSMLSPIIDENTAERKSDKTLEYGDLALDIQGLQGSFSTTDFNS
jgi:hypothetical protein